MRPFGHVLPAPLKAMLELLPARRPAPSVLDSPQVVPAEGPRRRRVALMTGCVQGALAPQINAATARILARHGCEVVIAKGAGCCGALTHHLGMEAAALASARANVAAWSAEIAGQGLDAIVINASGCGTVVKDYGFMLRLDPAFAHRARVVSERARDVSEFLGELGLGPAGRAPRLKIAYHSACSLQHGQKIAAMPKKLLQGAGFDVADVPEGHLCCGSAGTYNLLQPELATRLRSRKVANISTLAPDAIATGNIGCMTQLAAATATPVLHTVELLDWATGGPVPAALTAFARARS
jgi:glycolate oxidase iron-sulfur subunit